MKILKKLAMTTFWLGMLAFMTMIMFHIYHILMDIK